MTEHFPSVFETTHPRQHVTHLIESTREQANVLQLAASYKLYSATDARKYIDDACL